MTKLLTYYNSYLSKDSIYATYNRIKGEIHKTPVLSSQIINDISKSNIYFKCENFQKSGAFKFRGAMNAILQLSKNEVQNGVCTHSSGNHAGALAKAAKQHNIKAYIVMPENAPQAKIDAVRYYKGEITFCKPTLEAREANIKKIIEKTKAVEIHPYNNYNVINGQATAALELFEEYGEADIIMAPVGGGGLLSGTSLISKFTYPNIKVVAAEPYNANDAYRSFKSGKFIPSVNPNTIADGLLTSMGDITWPIIKNYVDDIVCCKEETIIYAMKLIWSRMKILVEPSSAVPLACILENKEKFKDKKVFVILSGGNIQPNKY